MKGCVRMDEGLYQMTQRAEGAADWKITDSMTQKV
jgi:hypothetical protein